MEFHNIMGKLLRQHNLTMEEMESAMGEIMEGQWNNSQLSSFLTALVIKGETIDEIAGAAKVMREKGVSIVLEDVFAIDTCGTGGDKSGTFNISTAVAIVAAAAGVTVFKHGNRSVSSKSGSADVLEALGVNISLSPAQVKACVESTGIGFLFAPTFHPAMKYAAPTRKELGLRTVFNILGPLTNPAKVKGQVLGVFSKDLMIPMAKVLQKLGVERALVIHGKDGLDEISLCGITHVIEVNGEKIKTYDITPEDLGVPSCSAEEILGGNAEENAEIICNVFEGEIGPKRDIVLVNAAAALFVAGKVSSLQEGVSVAREVIEKGAAIEKLRQWIQCSNEMLTCSVG